MAPIPATYRTNMKVQSLCSGKSHKWSELKTWFTISYRRVANSCENRSAQATSPCNPTAILYRVTSHIRNCLPPRTIICPYGVYATVGSWWGAISHEQSTPVGNVPLQSHYNPVCAESTKWLQHQTYVKDMMNGEEYRGNSLIKNSPLLEPLSRTMPRAIWWP